MGLDYKASGVDVEAGYRSVELIRDAVRSTNRPEVIGDLGGFAGAFSLSKICQMKDPVLLSGTDGVGTKLKLAFLLERHDTIGIDAVAMCVNDVVCAGGEPLFFLDYIACEKNIPEQIAEIVKGVAEGCRQSGCALIGGETAEHPGMMEAGEYDIAGFTVGVVERSELIDGHDIKAGDVCIGIASTGVHSNGFSLVRKVFDMSREALEQEEPRLGRTLGEALLEPTRIYVPLMKALKAAGIRVKGCSHITGGGWYENIPRMLPEGMNAELRKDAAPVPEILRLLQERGGLTEDVMYHTYNMGVGLVLAVDASDAAEVCRIAGTTGDRAYEIGRIVPGDRGITLC